MVKRKKSFTQLKKKDPALPPAVRKSDDPPLKKTKWVNRERILVFASRGITYRHRHLMEDLRSLLPHTKPDNKKEKKEAMFAINEMCEMKNCNKVLYFEARKKDDLYMWLSCVPEGPAIKFNVQNIHTMQELKLTGNCLKGSRAMLSFSEEFNGNSEYQLLKEVLSQFFTTPFHHPKSQPFTDHIFTFTVLDNKIWFRNFQIIEETGSLVEIGPRFVLNPVKILEGSFCGEPLWENSKYVSPNVVRREEKKKAKEKYMNKQIQKKAVEVRRGEETFHIDPTDFAFEG